MGALPVITRVLLSALSALLAAQAAPVSAQDVIAKSEPDKTSETYSSFKRDRNISVRQRPHPGYEALGLPAGPFMVWPKITATVEQTDNIFVTATDEQSDTIWRLNPEVGLTSNWSRHQLDAYARASINRYSEFSSEDTEDYSVGAQGRVAVARAAHIDAGADWSRLTEPRTAAPSQGLARPVQYEAASAFVSTAREFDRLRFAGRIDGRKFTFLNRAGNPQQHDRDRTLAQVTGRLDYAFDPNRALFVEIAGNTHDYRLSATPGVLAIFPGFENRDSAGLQVLTGANFEFSGQARGEIAAGYARQRFDNPLFGDISAIGARGQVEWFATPLTTITAFGSRTIEDAGVIGASGFLSTNVGAQVDHELRRNLILSAQVGFGDDAYRGIDRRDRRYTAGITATFLLNRGVGLVASYSRFQQESRGLAGGGDLSLDKVGASLILQY